jgi:hypothetical protein
MNVLKDILCTFWLLLLVIVWSLAGKATFYVGVALEALFPNGFFLPAAIFLIIFPLPVTIFAYIHHFLWGKADTNKPKWIASNASMHEAMWQWFIAVTASIVVIVMVIIFMSITGRFNNFYGSSQLEDKVNAYFSLVWFVIATLMFRWKRLWGKKTAAKKTKQEAKTVQQSVKQHLTLTVDDELELLKQQINKKPPESGGE